MVNTHPLTRFGWLVCFGTLWLVPTCVTAASEARERLQMALVAVQQELGGTTQGLSWHRFLRLESLHRQLARGRAADVAEIARIASRFAAADALRQRASFVFARRALDAWQEAITQPAANQLADRVRQTRVTPPSAEDVAQRQREAKTVAGLVDQRLATFGHREAEWRRALLWRQIVSQCQRSGPADATVLTRVARRFQIAAGLLNDPLIPQAQHAIDRWARDVRGHQATAEACRRCLDRLATRLDEQSRAPSPEGASGIAARLDWLEQRGLAASVVAAVRHVHCRPNLVLTLSQRLVNVAVDRPSTDQRPIHSSILGTDYRGTLQLDSRTSVAFVTSFDTIALRLLYHGDGVSRTLGRNGPATVRTRSTTTIDAETTATLSDRGLFCTPSRATGVVQSEILSVDWARLLGQQAATRQAYADQAATEQIAARRAEGDTQAEMDRWVRATLGPSNHMYQYRIRSPMIARGAFPEVFCCSTPQMGGLFLTLGAPRRLAAPSEPPPIDTASDLNLRLHTSMVDNFVAATLAGQTWCETEWERWLQETYAIVPEGLKTVDPERPWSITFAAQNPVAIRIDDGSLSITLSADGFAVGTKQYPGMRVSADYTIDATDDGLTAERRARLSIVPPDFQAGEGRRLGVRQQVFRSMLRKRLEPLLPSRLVIDRVRLPVAWERAGQLRVRHVNAGDGWLAIGCQWTPRLDRESNAPPAAARASGAL